MIGVNETDSSYVLLRHGGGPLPSSVLLGGMPDTYHEGRSQAGDRHLTSTKRVL
jgi:hypothetical protein